MKRTLFKQLMVSAFFACSLSADVPDMREHAKGAADDSNGSKRRLVRHSFSDGGTSNIKQRTLNESGRFRHFAVTTSPLRERGGKWSLSPSAWRGADVELYDGPAIRRLPSAVCRPSGTMPDPMSLVLSVVWPTDPLDAVFLFPRYRMFMALQESAWPAFADLPAPAEAGFAKAGALRAGRPRSVGSRLRESASPWQVWEPALSLDVAGRSDRADMAAMIPRLKKIFAQEGVPQQWVWMAEIESSLNPRAKSSAGAVGLFQLMPGTARRFGLQTKPVDDRMQPEKSAGAAAQYLKFLRREFGCWSLALAAYNAGEGRVREIMKKRKARTFEEVERYLPSETRSYVPKVMAIVALREDQLHGVRSAYWMP